MRKAIAGVLSIIAVLVIGGLVFHESVGRSAPLSGIRPTGNYVDPIPGEPVAEKAKDSARTPPLAFVADDDQTIREAFANLVAALEANDLPLALVIASTFRASASAAAIIHEEFFIGDAINPEATSSRFRIVALCLAAQDPEIAKLCATMKHGWKYDALTETNKKNWELINGRKPLSQRAASALSEPDHSLINGLMKALLYRLSDDADDTAEATWKQVWQALCEQGYVTDPLISVALWYPVQTYASQKLPEYWTPFFVSIRDDIRFSLRLRIQAAAAIAPVSNNVMDLLAHLSQSLGNHDAAEVLARFLGECPELSAEDWSLILSAMLNGRTLGDGSSILFDAIRSASKALRDGNRIGEYGDALIGLFTRESLESSLSTLAGEAIYTLIVWHFDPHNPRKRISVFTNIDSEDALHQLLQMLDAVLFTRPSLEPPFVNERIVKGTRILRIAFELSVSLNQKINVIHAVLSRCASTRERDFIAREALGSIGGLLDSEAGPASHSLLSTAFELCSIVLENGDTEDHWATVSACLNGLRLIRTLAELGEFPALSAAQLAVLQRQHDAFRDSSDALREVVADNNRLLAKIDQLASEFEKLEAAMDAAYSLVWLEEESSGDGE